MFNIAVTTPYPVERRRTQRFELELPIHVSRISEEDVDMDGQTRDLSSMGACFETSDSRIVPGSPIEFVVTLREGILLDKTIQLHCRGRVTRLEPVEAENRIAVATTIERYQFVRDFTDKHVASDPTLSLPQ